MSKKITLICLGESGRNIPVKGYSIGCQYSWNWFEPSIISMMDKEEWFVEKFKLLGKNVYDELNLLGKPVIVQKKWKNLKVPQIIYPIEEIIKEFGFKYLTCSQAYMIAYALYLGFEEIELVGFDNKLDSLKELKKDVEWLNIWWDEVACQNFWYGLAKGMGVNIHGSSGIGNIITPKNKWKYAYDVSPIHKRKRREILFDLKKKGKDNHGIKVKK